MKKFCVEAECGPSELHVEQKQRARNHVLECDVCKWSRVVD